MPICKVCKGSGRVIVRDDVYKHLTGRGKPPKTKTCYACKGSGQAKKSGCGCIWLLLLVGGIGSMIVFLPYA